VVFNVVTAVQSQALHIRGIYYSCIVELGNNSGTMCFGPLKNCFHTYLLVGLSCLASGSSTRGPTCMYRLESDLPQDMQGYLSAHCP